jgi:hypothetical protein
VHEELTRSTLFDFLCHNCKNSDHLRHDFHNYIHHFRRRRYLNVDLETMEEIFHAREDINESVLTRTDILCRLKFDVTVARASAGAYIPANRKGGASVDEVGVYA